MRRRRRRWCRRWKRRRRRRMVRGEQDSGSRGETRLVVVVR